MASRIEQIIEEIEEYVDSCRFCRQLQVPAAVNDEDRCEQGRT